MKNLETISFRGAKSVVTQFPVRRLIRHKRKCDIQFFQVTSMLRSDLSQVFLLKFWPIIFLVGFTVLFWKIGFGRAGLFVLVFVFLLSMFLASLAVIEIPDGTIRYRRLFNWRELPWEEIARCGVSRTGIGIGYISLKRFLWPWGKLYFVLGEVERGREPLLTFIQKRIGESLGPKL